MPKYKFVALIWLFAIAPLTGFAQTHTISGFISDAENGEKLIGASLYISGLNTGTVTNNYGFYSITLPPDSVYLQVSYIGYQTRYFAIDLQQNIELNIELQLEAVGLDNIEVVATQDGDQISTPQLSTIDVPVAEIKKLPVLFGEPDILKTIQLLPGVQAGSEGNSGLYVRGGGPDQNLILLDGAPVYNASHIFGFFSVFNSDALQNVKLIKGGFPSRYGGRLSSVLDISMKEGNTKEFEADGGIGIISSRLTLQGPIVKDKLSFIVSGRRTYIDVLARPFIRASDPETDPVFFFYDVNAKLNYVQSKRSRIYLSMYTGKDKFGASYTDTFGSQREESTAGLDWGNLTTTLRWNYLFSNKLFANTSLIYSQYSFNTLSEFLQIENTTPPRRQFDRVTYKSGIKDFTAKIDFDYRPSPNHYIRFGGNAIAHSFKPGVGRFRSEEAGQEPKITSLTPNANDFKGVEYYAYVEDDIQLTSSMRANIGGHFSGMQVEGTNYTSLQPRVTLTYAIKPNLNANLSFSTMQQYLHLLSNSGINLPTDLWVAATKKIKPQKAWQSTAGVNYSFAQNTYSVSLEGYYKDIKNLIEFKPGASFLASNDDWQNKVEIGNGWSGGAELFLQKKRGKTKGWIGYTLSWTRRQFDGLNQGRSYPYKYDRRHDLSVVLTHELKKNLDVGLTWVYGTGNAITLATSQFTSHPNIPFFYGETLANYGTRNSYRMAPYHRLDFAFNWKLKRALFSKRGDGIFSLSIYNVYNRKNPFFIYTTQEDERVGDTYQSRNIYKQVSLFPILPSISYSFHF